MRYLFRKELRDAVEDKYGENRIYQALRIPCISQMNDSEAFALHHSDLFYQTIFTIDEMKRWSDADIMKYISNALWDDLYSYFRENVGDDYKDDMKRAVAEVMYSLAMISAWSDNPRWIPMSASLIYQIEQHLPGYPDQVHKKFDDGFSMQKADSLRKYIATYLNSDEQISEDINDIIDRIGLEDKKEVIEKPASTNSGKAHGLSIGQLVIMFSSLLNASLNPGYDNQSALADIISRVSGKDSESVRQKIMSLGKAKKPLKQIKQDAEIVAKMLERYKPELASEIRDQYIDD